MPGKQQNKKHEDHEPTNLPRSFFACLNRDCADYNRFDAGNLSVAEWMGKRQSHPAVILYNLRRTL